MPNSRRTDPPQWIKQIHPHDVINGRGVNVAQHPGNQRFRALVKSHADQAYCTEYSALAKKAVAESIVQHIRNLNPPGRFLKRPTRKTTALIGEGVWEEMTDKDALKKTTQALRDCNRNDRTGYADSVEPPADVQARTWSRPGLTKQEYAEEMAQGSSLESSSGVAHVQPPPPPQQQLWVDTRVVDRQAPDVYAAAAADYTPKQSAITPATAASTGEFDRFPDHHQEDPDVTLPHPFDAFSAPSLDYDEDHFGSEEEEKLTALARQEATGNGKRRESEDFSTLFLDGDDQVI